MRRRLLVSAIAALGLVACNAILGLDGDTEIAGSGIDASSTDSIAPPAHGDGSSDDHAVPGQDSAPIEAGPELDAGDDAPDPQSFALTLFAGALGGLGDGDGVRDGARFDHVIGVAGDKAGIAYVIEANADIGRHSYRVRRIDQGGAVTTLAGKRDEQGFADGTFDVARFTDLKSIAYDSLNGRLWVLDGCSLRRLDLDGEMVTTVAGTGGSASECVAPTDTNAAAGLSAGANAIAVDGNGRVYVSDPPYIRVYDDGQKKLTAFCGASAGTVGPTGSCSSVKVNTRELGYSPFEDALLFRPDLGTAAPIVTIALQPPGPAVAALTADGGIGGTTYVSGPGIVAGRYAGTIIAGEGKQLHYVDRGGGMSFVAAGSNAEPAAHVDGDAMGARFEEISGLAPRYDVPGDYFLADRSTVRISNGTTIGTLAGAAPSAMLVQDAGTAARFGNASSMALGDGKVYFFDSIFATVNVFDVTTHEVTILAGIPGRVDDLLVKPLFPRSGALVYNGAHLFFSAGATAKLAVLRDINLENGEQTAVKKDFALGQVLAADPTTKTIYFRDEKGSGISTWDGESETTTPLVSTVGGSTFESISGMCWEPSIGALVVADRGTNVISTVTSSESTGTVVTPIAGFPKDASHRDAAEGTSAAFVQPDGVACDGKGNVIVNETATGSLRVIELKHNARVTTIAGRVDGQQGVLLGTPGRLNATSAIVFLPQGPLLIGSANEGVLLALTKR